MTQDRIGSTEYPDSSQPHLQQQNHQDDRYRHQQHRPELESVTESNSQEGDLVNATITSKSASHDSPITLAGLPVQEDHDGAQQTGGSLTGQRGYGSMFDAGVSPGTRVDLGSDHDVPGSDEVVDSSSPSDVRRQDGPPHRETISEPLANSGDRTLGKRDTESNIDASNAIELNSGQPLLGNRARSGTQPVVISGFQPQQSNRDLEGLESSPSSIRQPPRRSSLTQSLRLHSLPVPPFPDNLRPQQSENVNAPPEISETDDSHLYNNRSEVNSAPPSPAAITVLHPSAYIHTHHPRRGSLTPLNLNTISPVPPPPNVMACVRRASHAPSADGWSLPGGSGVRRKSLSPTMPTLAAISPNRIAATGSASRRMGAWTGDASKSGARLVPPEVRRSSLRPLTAGDASSRASKGLASDLGTRRASQPTTQGYERLEYDPSTIATTTPVVDSYRLNFATGQTLGSESLGAGIRQDFKFGEASASPLASGSLPRSRSRSSSNGSKSSPSSRTLASNRFSDGDSIEAERQRIAFLNSTYNTGGRGSVPSRMDELAPDRSPGHPKASPLGIPSGTMLGNEGYRRGSLGLPGYEDMSPSMQASPSRSLKAAGISSGRLGPLFQPDGRRGSNPINIPRKKKNDRYSGEQAQDESYDDTGSMAELSRTPPQASASNTKGTQSRRTSPLSRPLPPLLPLSDPGPRLLPSTLALHRANHLLHSKNLNSEPMPHPLPASLHPPPPVDVTDFDIDFILAGATAPTTPGILASGGALSGEGMQTSAVGSSTLKLGPGGDDEDTFAKFVGAFDEEYDDRRDDWTFKACTNQSKTADRSIASQEMAEGTVEWEAQRAGRYVISVSGEVTSKHTGSTWRATKRGPREIELEHVPVVPEGKSASSFVNCPGACIFVLASKAIHNELGGVKVGRRRLTVQLAQNGDGMQGSTNAETHGILAALSESHGSNESIRSSPLNLRGRHDRPTAPVASRRNSKSQDPATSQSFSQKSQQLLTGSHSDSPKREKKDKVSIGDKIKRTWKSGFGAGPGSLIDDLRERKEEKRQRQQEKQQSQSWSGTSSHSSAWTSIGHSSTSSAGVPSQSREVATASTGETRYQPPWMVTGTKSLSDRRRISAESPMDRSGSPQIVSRDGSIAPMSYKEGKAWEAVPEDAMAMVIPLSTTEIPTEIPSSLATAPSLRTDSFFDKPPSASLLVYFVPFVSGTSNLDRPSQAARRASMGQRIKRSRSREQVNLNLTAPSLDNEDNSSTQLVPLPFRSFRIVARVVEADDVRSEPILAPWPEETSQTGKTVGTEALSESPTDGTGTRFPTVIAVCHSRAQGVEFVLEGLDRLGLCEGNSAWGPTGYEEWRGSGLSLDGRRILDALWTACAAIMGLTSQST